MSSHYNTEPPPTASVLLRTTAGPIQISIFATQTPLASRNFLQHVLDGYYESTTFHRVVPGFVIQGGDPTGTGDGGENIYEDKEFEVDVKTGEKLVFGDELHTRLKFNRRGLLGMAKMGESTYGSQFFITLADARQQLDGNCTMFGRVEGDGIYNVVRIAEAEIVKGTERPMYPVKITGAEVLEMPKGEPWATMKKRDRVAKRNAPEIEDDRVRKKAKVKKRGKAMLSFGGEEADEDAALAIQTKAKFNTTLINSTETAVSRIATGKKAQSRISERQSDSSQIKSKLDDVIQATIHSNFPPSPCSSRLPVHHSESNLKSPERHHRRPSFHESTTQLPLKDPESPSRSPSLSPPASPKPASKTSTLQAEIAALKASMRRTEPTAPEPTRKKNALEQMIPGTSIRGRRRPVPGNSSNDNNNSALKILTAFKARLEGAEQAVTASHHSIGDKANSLNEKSRLSPIGSTDAEGRKVGADDDEEATICDLHFIANCQSCSKWETAFDPTGSHDTVTKATSDDEAAGTSWMTHALTFEKDRLGKDLSWKRKNEELVVIDPREKEREIRGSGRREREMGKEGEWRGRGA